MFIHHLKGAAALLLTTGFLSGEVIAFPTLAKASSIAVNLGSGGLENNFLEEGPATIGWAFHVSRTLLVTDLGYFSAAPSGLLEAHQVGIWTSDETLIVSAVVPSGTTATLDQGFRFVPVSPFELGVGDYVIGGFSDPNMDEFRFQVPSVTTLPGLTVNGPRYVYFPDLAFPFVDPGPFYKFGYFGPNLEANVVPEPPTAFLILPVMIGGLLLQLRHRKELR